MIKYANVVIYEQQNIFGEWERKVQEKTVLIVKRKKDGKLLIKKWWRKEEKYTDELSFAAKYRKRNNFPQNEKERRCRRIVPLRRINILG